MLSFYPQSAISIHAPARGATARLIKKPWSALYFNPRSREGSDSTDSVHQCLIAYFNPRSREGSDTIEMRPLGTDKRISIHAPARGATMRSSILHCRSVISIHAPARGATARQQINRLTGCNFNQRSREGSDAFLSCIKYPIRISIHAPVRGATAILPPFLPYSSNFNPRSREGSD